jgi:DNA-binding FadR family transcriptional regulator
MSSTAHRDGAYTAVSVISRTQQVRDQLEAAIERGDYKAGDRLPSQRELVDLFGVSRVSVREAIRSLEAIGLLEVHHGRGCFVAASRSDRYAGSFGRWLAIHRDEVLELLKVRGALDELAAECAAARGDAASLRRVRETADAFRAVAESAGGVERLAAHDLAFHAAIGEASGSPLLADLLLELHTTLGESRHATLAPPGRPGLSAREHDAIVEALAAGDAAAARRAVARHIGSVRDFLITTEETSEH